MPSKKAPVRNASSAKQDRSRAIVLDGRHIAVPALEAGLYVVATPIGNLGDISLRALKTLAGADKIACEDTRVTRRLLDAYGITARLVAYHDHNAEKQRPVLLRQIMEGGSVALVSDAGTPLVSDPGYKLVSEAIGLGLKVTTLPGPSAPVAALVLSGLPSDRFFFEGFLPPKSGARRNRLDLLKDVPASLLFFESSGRLAGALADMADRLGDRPAAVVREISKLFEEARRGPLVELAEYYATAGNPKGEIVVVVAPPPDGGAMDESDLDALLMQLLRELSVRDAAAEAARRTGIKRKQAYARALLLCGDERQ